MNSSESDPLKLDKVDREIRLENLKRQIQDIAGGKAIFGKAPNCDPEVEEAFLENVLALETEACVRPLDVLQQKGFNFAPPERLSDAALTVTLWELIRVLAAHRVYLYCTDHLSDRELYGWLWHDALRQEFMGFGLPFGNCHLDVLGRCSEEDLILQMRFYADAEDRARWAEEFPDFPMPPREKPPFDRDRHLPQAYPNA